VDLSGGSHHGSAIDRLARCRLRLLPLAARGDVDEAEAKWLSLNDEIDRTLSSVPLGSLPGILEDLRRLVTEVSGWNGSGGQRRWIFDSITRSSVRTGLFFTFRRVNLPGPPC